MPKNSQSSVATGITFPMLLAILFIGLKLANYIDWSWWWVLSPIWLPIGIVLLVVGITIMISVFKK